MCKCIVHKGVVRYNVVYAASMIYQTHTLISYMIYQTHALTSTNFNVYTVIEHERGSFLQPQRIQRKLQLHSQLHSYQFYL